LRTRAIPELFDGGVQFEEALHVPLPLYLYCPPFIV